MRLKLFLISLTIYLGIDEVISMDTPQSLAQRQEDMLTHVAKILGNAIENQFTEKYRSVRSANEAAKQYMDEQFDNLKEMLNKYYKIQNPGEKLLKKILDCTNGITKMWPFVAKYYAQKAYDMDFLIRLFETKPNIDNFHKFEILSYIIQNGGPRDRLMAYIVGLIRKGDLQPNEICVAMVFFVEYNLHNLLNESDWLAMIDGVFPEHPSLNTLKGNKGDLEFRDFLLRHIESAKLGLKLYQDRERYERQSIPGEGHLNTLKILKDLNVMLHYPKACNDMRYILTRTKRPFAMDMSLVRHLSYRFKDEVPIRDHLMARWEGHTNLSNTTLSMDQLNILMNQARNITNHDLAQRLFQRANHLVKPIQTISYPTITFVAGPEPSGDGHTPDSLDYFRGVRYIQMGVIFPKLIERGFAPKVISWKDPTIRWEDYTLLVIGPIWGYSREQAEFRNWLSKIKSHQISLINAMDFINWNIKKTYLIDLQDEEIPVIPTIIIEENSTLTFQDILGQTQEKFGTTDIILKGVIGAGGFDYYHYTPGHKNEAQAHLKVLKRDNWGAVIQPFCPEFSKKGELSFVVAGGTPLFLFWKICAPKSELVQEFYGGKSFHPGEEDLSSNWEEFYSKIKAFNPDIEVSKIEMQTACEQIHKLIFDLKKIYSKHNIPEPPLYRLDVVVKSGENGVHIVVGEIEAIEPYLELGKTKNSELAVKRYVDELIRQYSIHMGKK